MSSGLSCCAGGDGWLAWESPDHHGSPGINATHPGASAVHLKSCSSPLMFDAGKAPDAVAACTCLTALVLVICEAVALAVGALDALVAVALVTHQIPLADDIDNSSRSARNREAIFSRLGASQYAKTCAWIPPWYAVGDRYGTGFVMDRVNGSLDRCGCGCGCV